MGDYSDISTDHLEIFKNFQPQLPSQRRQEHKRLKEGIEQYNKGRNEIFNMKKQFRTLQRKHSSGILGIDGPMSKEKSSLYSERQNNYILQEEKRAREAQKRFSQLQDKMKSDPSITGETYLALENGEMPNKNLPRSHDIPIQRKNVDWVKYPYRYFDTHERLFASETTVWDPARARAKRSHEIREKHYDIVNHCDNSLDIRTLQRQN